MVKRSIIKIIDRFMSALEENDIYVDKVILYGSYAQGIPRIDSDIDVAVVSRDFGKDIIEEGMMLFRIAGDVDTRIEPVAISLESYEKNMWMPLIYEIREKGIEIDIRRDRVYAGTSKIR